jgi:hypothetical protein
MTSNIRIIIKGLVAYLLLLLIAFPIYAQIDSTETEDDSGLEQTIEDLISNTETDDQVDFTYLTDYLNDLRLRPLNINKASSEQLKALPGMDDLLVVALQNHIQQFGELASIYELQAVQGFTPEVFEQIKPYISISTGRMDRSGPPPKVILQGLKGDITQRGVFLLEPQRGYSPREDSSDTRYAGPAYQSYTRIRLNYYPNFSFALTAEKDRGEPWRWDPQNRYYGYDFTSGHIMIREYGKIKRLVFGDYTLESGQGLVLSRGLGFGKGATVIRSTKMPDRGIRPYSSVNENQFLRGAAATLGFGKLEVTSFYSRNRFDASVQSLDTLSEEAEIVGSIQLGGLHRTPSELANRKAIRETAFGGKLVYRHRKLKVGVTQLWQQFDARIERPVNAYNQFDFRGDQNHVTSVDFDWLVSNFNFFGEVARSRSGGLAATAGMMASVAPTMDVSMVARSFDPDFHSFKGYAFAERPTALRNEQGLYLGVRIKPNYTWTISGYFDQYYYAWNKFGTGFPSKGYEYLLQVNYRLARSSNFYVRFRSDNKESNGNLLFQDSNDPQLQYLAASRRLQLRFHYSTTIDRKLTLRSRLEFSHYTKEEELHTGFLLYQDVAWKPTFSWRFTARYAIFDAPDYDARIYAYENDVLGFFSIPAYYRTGSRFYFIAYRKLGSRWEMWARLAQSRFRDVRTIGSGLEQIEGDTRTEVKLQVRYKL